MVCQAPQSSQPIKKNRSTEYRCNYLQSEDTTFAIAVPQKSLASKSKHFCKVTGLKITVTQELAIASNADGLWAATQSFL